MGPTTVSRPGFRRHSSHLAGVLSVQWLQAAAHGALRTVDVPYTVLPTLGVLIHVFIRQTLWSILRPAVSRQLVNHKPGGPGRQEVGEEKESEVLWIPALVPGSVRGVGGERGGDSPTTTFSPIHRLPGVPIAAQGFGRDPQQRSQQQRPRCCHEATAMDSERPGTAGSRDSD